LPLFRDSYTQMDGRDERVEPVVVLSCDVHQIMTVLTFLMVALAATNLGSRCSFRTLLRFVAEFEESGCRGRLPLHRMC